MFLTTVFPLGKKFQQQFETKIVFKDKISFKPKFHNKHNLTSTTYSTTTYICNGKDKGKLLISIVEYGSGWGREMSDKIQTNSDWTSKNLFSPVQISAISDFY